MRVADFDYELPEALIAQHPLPERSAARLLHVSAAGLADRRVADLPALLRPGDLLVLNDTRVLKARLLGRKESGGRVEVLVERIEAPRRALAHVRASRAPRPGTGIEVEGGGRLTVRGRAGGLFEVESDEPLEALLERCGRVPLPPYIRRAAEAEDLARYQTVWARRPGAVAAPTAGLHFDEALLAAVRARGVETAQVTLHVGAGTFQPVRVEEVERHAMHAERVVVDEAAVAAVARTRARGGRVVAVGTTVVRALESAAAAGALRPLRGETRLFIYPGHRFRVVDALLTNFHLPRSTLLMLVCAFAGRERVLAAYRHAVAQRYRFFSYGDAMFLDETARHAL
ncbi:tRNA preQ1(34) S-adenosylmethionine ribosyltransferase-isomerase QueA [Inmirania thermothiophila]|uniref:S-adenosylmethionine:tRNA ribosyltransferase-isomerase n=1 Tax=Inmirania thermothiophila TaxID=1750597 RepID=A0A3N1Y1W3_9GAMM|nr:tRNA preQ1(34) S-adenosylmethionine ribosyltransferase-isomerase QueA [Inmirania thermothiophila]ROR32810.1 S-adenosylmethionine:tRNA ribosyltransferase-isomerase [Inmirania thermothiophila]